MRPEVPAPPPMIVAWLVAALVACAPAPDAGEGTATAVRTPPRTAEVAEAAQADSDAAGERQRIAGMSGIGAASSLRMVGVVDQEPALRLETSYAFPDRARWWLGRAAADRRIFYRFGARCWQLPPGAGASAEIEGEQRTGLFGSMELRRALLLWPHGFEWSGADDAREVDLGALGRIAVRLVDGLPVELALWRGGQRVEAFTDVRWRAHGERHVPASLRLLNGDTPVWDETFERAGPETLVDGVFLPPDRRAAVPADTSSSEGLVQLPPRTTRRVALPEPLGPLTAWRTGRELHQRTAAELPNGMVLEPHLALELSSTGAVQAVVLRLAGAPSPPPEGWIAEAGRSGATGFLAGLEAIDGPAIATLARRLGGRVAGTPYAVVEVARAGQVQLVVPVQPPG